jgi:hypothetical protein
MLRPKWDELLQFLQHRCHTLESIERRNNGAPLKITSSTPKSSYRNYEKKSQTEAFAATSDAGRPPIKCPMYEKAHYINQCSEFLALTNVTSWAQVKRLNYCTNCLSCRDTVKSCRAETCRECRQKHHSLLQQPQPKAE